MMLRIFQQRKEHCDGNEASWPAPTAGERRAGPITRPCRLRGHMKHPKAKFPETNGWEFFSLELATALPPDPSPPATRIKARGDKVVNFVGVTCLSCHIPAARYDFVCEKGHGCAPIPIDDKKIAEVQGMDPRCPANNAGKP